MFINDYGQIRFNFSWYRSITVYFSTCSEIGFICPINSSLCNRLASYARLFPHLYLRKAQSFLLTSTFQMQQLFSALAFLYSWFSQTAWLHLCKVAEGCPLQARWSRVSSAITGDAVAFCGLSGLWGQMLLWVGIWLASQFSMDFTCCSGLGRKPVSTGRPGAGRQPLCRWFWRNLLLAFLIPAGFKFPGPSAEPGSKLTLFARQFTGSFGFN